MYHIHSHYSPFAEEPWVLVKFVTLCNLMCR